MEQARGLWRDLGNLHMLTDNLGYASIHGSYARDLEAMLRFSDEEFQLSWSIGNTWGEAHTRFLVGDVYLERGEWAEGIQTMHSAIRAAEQAGNPGVQVGTRAELARLLGEAGAIERAIELATNAENTVRRGFDILRSLPLAVLAELQLRQGNIEKAERVAKEARRILLTGSLIAPTLISLVEGEIKLAEGHHVQAIKCADELLAFLRKAKYRILVAGALYLKAKSLAVQRKDDKALAMLQDARENGEELGSRRILWQILALASEIEARRGNDTGSRKLRRHACETIPYIADHTPPDLRAIFRNQLRIRTLLDSIN